MVQTLEKFVLLTAPFTVLFDLLQAVWHLSTTERMLDDPAPAEQHRQVDQFGQTATQSPAPWIVRCIAAKWLVSRVAFAPSPFILSLIPFFIGCRGFPRS